MKERARIRVAVWHFAFLAAFVFLLVAPAAWADDVPWLKPDSASNYVFVNHAVYDASTGKQVSPNGAPDLGIPFLDGQPVLGAPDKILHHWTTNSGVEALGFGDGIKTPVLAGLGVAPFAARDQRRLVWAQGGDVWRGEADWANGKIVNAKQLTNVGSFQSLSPLLWSGQFLFDNGNFDPQKPIVRINLATGATDELSINDVGLAMGRNGTASIISPNCVHVVWATPDAIYSYDTRTNKRLLISNDIKIALDRKNPQYWVNDDLVYVLILNQTGNIAKLDLRNGTAELVIHPDPAQPAFTATSFIRAVTRTSADTTAAQPNPVGMLIQNTQYALAIVGDSGVQTLLLIDVTTGKRTTLPFHFQDSNITWLDGGHYCMYHRSSGGLSAAGTWLYHVDTDSSVKLTGGTVNDALILPDQTQLWAAYSSGTSPSLTRVKLDGSGSDIIAQGGFGDLRTLPAPIDLGLAGTAVGDLWQPVVVDAASIAPTQSPTPLQGKAKFLRDIGDLSGDDQVFAVSAYDYADASLPCYDPAKLAIKALDAHKQQPSAQVRTLLTSMDYGDAFDHDRAAAYGQSRATKLLAGTRDPKLTADNKQEISELTGTSFADKLATLTKPSAADINRTFNSCYAAARKSVLQPG